MNSDNVCPRVLNILITFLVAPLRETLKRIPKCQLRWHNIPSHYDLIHVFGKALITLFQK